ncbi:hypothetical protein [Pseudoduganella armeniaca]|uniref:Pentapeptide repeat-containing protein n=1 Tax=Pseudoduganella armeniaca TaxID=2072590 RepID=A0A2R4CC14_9BURK|nr:hypothetical protein [Pseudoduganella armeniaca]AVR97156.1 hypothetical protein C9I28_17040 [Pseudoduganella armeniaca]
MKLKAITMTRERVLLSNVEVNQLGPELVFEECDIYSDCQSKALVMSGVRMIGGRFFQQDRALADHQFSRVHFNGVRFFGTFIGCDFGNWDSNDIGSMANCDFTEAVLDSSRFLNVDVQSIKLPRWPCFTIVNPAEAREFVMGNKWSAKTRIALDVYTDVDPECTASLGDASRMAKQDGIALEDLRERLLAIPGIRIRD